MDSTTPAPAPGPYYERNDVTDLCALLDRATCVLFDFDGPVCRLFHGHPASTVADDLRTWLAARECEIGEEARESPDPMAVLRDVGRKYPAGAVVEGLEARLTRYELQAARSACPTAYADPLIRTLRAVGKRLAVTTNNSPEAVAHYLRERETAACFGPHIHGRTRELRKLKPDPDCLLRALASTGTGAADTLMIGDTPEDLWAAERAGVAFLGFARNERKQKLLTDAGAGTVVDTLLPVLEAVRRG